MSAMQELYRKVAGNSALQEKLNQIMLDATKDGQNAAAAEQKLLDFARDAGFEITLEEMQSFFQGMVAQAKGDLTDAELDQVAGGKVNGITIVGSIFTVGIACALGSIIDAVRGKCEDYFTRENLDDGSFR